MHTNPFNRRTSIIVRWVTLMPEKGGLKGKKAPGDAHPYLVLFCWGKYGIITGLRSTRLTQDRRCVLSVRGALKVTGILVIVAGVVATVAVVAVILVIDEMTGGEIISR